MLKILSASQAEGVNMNSASASYGAASFHVGVRARRWQCHATSQR